MFTTLRVEWNIWKLRSSSGRTQLVGTRALLRIGAPAVKRLISELRYNHVTQVRVAQILGDLGDSRAIAPLIDALNKCDRGFFGIGMNSAVVKEMIYEALEKLGVQ